MTLPAAVSTTSVVGGTNSIADLFVFGKYISLLDTRVVAGGRSAAFEILSREVVHVQVPANAIPTTTEDGKTYIEIFLSTPNGISNSLLVPYKTAATTNLQLAYTLSTQSFDVYYQWLTGLDGKPALVATVDPGSKGVTIGWDSSTSLAPRRLQVTFQGSVGGQGFTFAVPADLGGSGDYSVNGQVFTATLLNRLQQIVPPPCTVTTPVTLNVCVQPWVPPDAEDLRVRPEAKQLTSPLSVNLNYNATGQNALQGILPYSTPPAAAGGKGAMIGPVNRGQTVSDARLRDSALQRTAQSAPERAGLVQSASAAAIPQQSRAPVAQRGQRGRAGRPDAHGATIQSQSGPVHVDVPDSVGRPLVSWAIRSGLPWRTRPLHHRASQSSSCRRRWSSCRPSRISRIPTPSRGCTRHLRSWATA